MTETRSKLYRVWENIRRRCNSQKCVDYKNYGGRGISVCAEWDTFAAFKLWAIESGYQEGLTIDRIDNDGDYRPDNCRWTSMRRQMNNKRNNVCYTCDGVTLTRRQWARRLGIDDNTLLDRVRRHGEEVAIRMGGPRPISSIERDKLREVSDE